ncbi:uncharacterized protein [Rutidosis leptorrhynchoides]|uniref:uncharacterized protein n=1 Tax=Rutidosis leptorrhynchoides TaxID=125765 RepID=UPI003A9934DD
MALLIDDKRLGTHSSSETLLNKAVPQKIGIFVWRAKQKRIPVRVELDKRGIDLDSILCPLCSNNTETVDHTLLECTKVKELWLLFFKWWNSSNANLSSLEQIFDYTSAHPGITKVGKQIWQSAKWACSYFIWRARNEVVFKNKVWNGDSILTNIQTASFAWISKRLKKSNLDWSQWLINPSSFISSNHNRSGVG